MVLIYACGAKPVLTFGDLIPNKSEKFNDSSKSVISEWSNKFHAA